MILAVDEINSWGGVNGREMELIIEDSKTNPEEGKKAFHKIEAAHHPVLYVSTTSSVSMALGPLAEKNKVVLVGLVVTTPELTKQKEWIFRYYLSAENEVSPILSVLERLKVKKLGILYLNDSFGRSIFELLKEKFERNGGTVTYEKFETNTSDFKKKITQLKNMEAIYTVGFVYHYSDILRQLKEEIERLRRNGQGA